MLSDVVGRSGLAGYAIAALIVFMLVFATIVARTFWPGRKAELDRQSRLPLEDEGPAAHRPGDPQ
jgi:cbb3-type cytochrome oxidase subunit 3